MKDGECVIDLVVSFMYSKVHQAKSPRDAAARLWEALQVKVKVVEVVNVSLMFHILVFRALEGGSRPAMLEDAIKLLPFLGEEKY